MTNVLFHPSLLEPATVDATGTVLSANSAASAAQSTSAASASAAMWAVICFCGLGIAILIGWQPVLWLQPTIVGILWGGLFLSGFACGSFGRGRLSWAVGAVGFAGIANTAFSRLTDFAGADCLLVSCLLMSVGWLSAKAGSAAWTAFPKQPKTEIDGWSRFSIWDIAFATCMVALACSAIPRLESHPALLLGVFVALVGGILCCWTACRWAFHDGWPVGRVACLVLVAAAAIGLVLAQSPMSLGHTLSWLLVGPLNVIASQATTVLFFCGLLRWDRFRAD